MLYPAVPFVRLGSLDRRPAFDVCVVGSGPAGAVLGHDLAQRGWTVLILEAGPKPGIGASNSVAELDAYESSGSINYPFASSHYQGLGGSSNLWFGASPRLHPLDLEKNAYTPADAAWPLSYSDLAPFYEQAESTLRVEAGPLSGQHPPRKRDLPPGKSNNSRAVKHMLREVGVTVDTAPMSKGPGGRDAFRVSRDLLPGVSGERHDSLICRGTVTRLLAESSGHIAGAEVRNSEGEHRVVQARVYVVACGGLQSARLLLLSRCGSFPDGIGNSSGVAGKYFMEHLKITFDGIIPHQRLSGSGRSHQFYEEFKRQGLGSVILGFGVARRGRQQVLRISADIEMFPAQENRVVLAHDLHDRFGNSGLDLRLNLSVNDVASVNAVRALIRRIYADLGAVGVAALTNERGDVSWLYHHMGTCRMGLDPKNSVTDGHLRVHDSPNLYIAGSAAFVTGGASNPTLTIAALSHRLASHVDSRLRLT